MDQSPLTMDATKEKIERIASLVEEKGQDKERFLELLQGILERGSSKEIDAFLRVLADEESFQAFYTLISVKEEEGDEQREKLLEQKLRSRAKKAREDIEAGRTLSVDEVRERTDRFLRENYEG